MRFLSVFRRAPQHKIAAASKTPPSQYLPPASGYGVRAALAISAILLVLSSAGFGAYFAWSQAEHHGPALAVLAVAMALGLETAKPFAVEAVFDCLRRWAIGRALAMLALAIVAIGYSLTAELSLMAQTRGDATATREPHRMPVGRP
jgi:disulfide bond formation protein DsbB